MILLCSGGMTHFNDLMSQIYAIVFELKTIGNAMKINLAYWGIDVLAYWLKIPQIL